MSLGIVYLLHSEGQKENTELLHICYFHIYLLKYREFSAPLLQAERGKQDLVSDF